MRRSSPACHSILVTTMVVLSAVSFPAFAQNPPAGSIVAEAQALMQQGQQSQALEKVDRALAANPRDRQARFLKGVILTELNKLDEAAAVFVKLTQDAPELPEPYNNLAVIYAQQKQYDKAKAALEMAIRTNPSYAVAHENLGDLYAKMAREAYDKALQTDSGNTNAQAKLNLLRELTAGPARPSAPAAPARQVTIAAAPPAPVAPSPVQPPKPAQPQPAQAVAANTGTKPAPTPPAPPVASVATSAAAASAKSSSSSSSSTPAEDGKGAVRSAVLGWASAWSNKNAREYLSFYAKDFQVPDRKSRKDWEEERAQRVTKPGNIKVTIAELDIRLNGEHATARFKQHYDSANFNSASGKTLELAQRNGHWQIVQERIGR